LARAARAARAAALLQVDLQVQLDQIPQVLD
jgi:hypothetical protein